MMQGWGQKAQEAKNGQEAHWRFRDRCRRGRKRQRKRDVVLSITTDLMLRGIITHCYQNSVSLYGLGVSRGEIQTFLSLSSKK